jgi:hydrogenase maturation protease
VGIPTLVLGIGNVLWADEGFGVRVVEALHAGWRFPDSVTFMDGGTQGLYLLPHVQGAQRLLVFDAIDYHLAPGMLQVVRDSDIPSYLGVGKMSLHQSSFQEVLSLAQLSGKSPRQAALVGVQPDVLADFGGSLSVAVRSAVPNAIAVGLRILEAWGTPGEKRDRPAAGGLFDASLAMATYESGRPSEESACRIGDARVLAQRPRKDA